MHTANGHANISERGYIEDRERDDIKSNWISHFSKDNLQTF